MHRLENGWKFGGLALPDLIQITMHFLLGVVDGDELSIEVLEV